jgi:hypothetical protein
MNLSPVGKYNKCSKPQVNGFLAAYEGSIWYDVLLPCHLTTSHSLAPPLNVNAPQNGYIFHIPDNKIQAEKQWKTIIKRTWNRSGRGGG